MSGPSLDSDSLKSVCFELACFGLEEVVLGCDRGVPRLELCSHREQDGLTPDEAMVETALRLRRPGKTRLMVMLRPDTEDNNLSKQRLRLIRESVMNFRNTGVEGFVVGLSTAEGQLPEMVLKDLMELAPGQQWVFHRLIDQLPDPLSAMRELQSWGFCRVLSSGGQPTAMQGWNNLMAWQAALPRIELLAGGGLRAGHLREILFHYPHRDLWPRGGIHSSCLAESLDLLHSAATVSVEDLEAFMGLCWGK
jgi:copper homeostasis protein